MGLKSRAARGGGGGEPQEDKAPRRPSILVPPNPTGRAGRRTSPAAVAEVGLRRRRTGGLPGSGPAATHPTATRPVPSPTLTLQQPLDDAVDVELVYIRHRLSAAGRTPPRGSPPSARCSAGPTCLLVLSRFSPSSSLSFFPHSLPPPRPPLDCRSQQRPSTEQNGRRLLSELGRRMDTTSATRLTGNPL